MALLQRCFSLGVVGLVRRLLNLGILGYALRMSRVNGFIILCRGYLDLLSFAFGVGLNSRDIGRGIVGIINRRLLYGWFLAHCLPASREATALPLVTYCDRFFVGQGSSIGISNGLVVNI